MNLISVNIYQVVTEAQYTRQKNKFKLLYMLKTLGDIYQIIASRSEGCPA